MTDPALVGHVIKQGRALAGFLQAVYKRRLRAIAEAAPSWVSEETLSASEHIGDKRAALWMSDTPISPEQ